ncbi:Endoplasmic reticulum aminopeptidase 2, partial [Stegodyphus mimosarum]
MDKDKIRPQDMFMAIAYSARNLNGRSLTWNFVRSNWNRFLEIFGEEFFALGMIINEAASYFSTQA